MDNSVKANIILHGGPSSLALDERMRYVDNTVDKVKLLVGNRYEHFEPTSQTEQRLGCDLRIYIWTGCTYVAE